MYYELQRAGDHMMVLMGRVLFPACRCVFRLSLIGIRSVSAFMRMVVVAAVGIRFGITTAATAIRVLFFRRFSKFSSLAENTADYF